jgi:hypothetical protein
VTPIILAAALDGVPHHQLLVNLAPEAPAQFASFERLIEVVGATPEARDSGRSGIVSIVSAAIRSRTMTLARPREMRHERTHDFAGHSAAGSQ